MAEAPGALRGGAAAGAGRLPPVWGVQGAVQAPLADVSSFCLADISLHSELVCVPLSIVSERSGVIYLHP